MARLRIASWNINGLRATVKSGAWDAFLKLNFDIFCLQEVKASEDQLSEEIRNPLSWQGYFDVSVHKKGYSGTSIYTKITPKSVQRGLGNKEFDDEGRLVTLDFGSWVLINGYFPNGGSGPDRLEYKLKYYQAFLKYIEDIRRNGKEVLFCGDINTAHFPIDLARPKANEKNTGFLPIERAWLDEVVSHGYQDIFRKFYPEKAEIYTYWDQKTRSRDRNVGWRIDYFFADPAMSNRIKGFTTHTTFMGSDHCPISIEVDIVI